VAGEQRTPIHATIATSAPRLLVHSQQQLLAGTQLEFLFRTPGGAELSMRADVRHVQHLQIESPEIWEAGCEFREADLDRREQLVRFVVNHQTSLSAACSKQLVRHTSGGWAKDGDLQLELDLLTDSQPPVSRECSSSGPRRAVDLTGGAEPAPQSTSSVGHRRGADQFQ